MQQRTRLNSLSTSMYTKKSTVSQHRTNRIGISVLLTFHIFSLFQSGLFAHTICAWRVDVRSVELPSTSFLSLNCW